MARSCCRRPTATSRSRGCWRSTPSTTSRASSASAWTAPTGPVCRGGGGRPAGRKMPGTADRSASPFPTVSLRGGRHCAGILTPCRVAVEHRDESGAQADRSVRVYPPHEPTDHTRSDSRARSGGDQGGHEFLRAVLSFPVRQKASVMRWATGSWRVVGSTAPISRCRWPLRDGCTWCISVHLERLVRFGALQDPACDADCD